MKRFLLVLALLGASACANQTRWAKARYSITMDEVVEKCVPAESYALPVFRTSFMAFRYSECLGVVDVFAVAWGEGNTEFEDKLADVLMLEYLRLHNENNKDNQLGHVFIMHDRDKEVGLNMKFWYFLDMAEQ